MTLKFGTRGTGRMVEQTDIFSPKFDAHGLIPAIVQDNTSGEILMFAFMNDQALEKTLTTGTAHFWSRSRGKLWLKGETSGEILKVDAVKTDCDQDVIALKVTPQGRGAACHTGKRSCFYRDIELPAIEGSPPRLKDTGGPALFDPAAVYEN